MYHIVILPYVRNHIPRAKDVRAKYPSFYGWVHDTTTEEVRFRFLDEEEALVFKLTHG